MKNKLVSIIIPVYGVEKYIEMSLESICKQSYKEIELILIDDETKDDSILKAKTVLRRYPDISHKIVHEKNKGLPGARNEGIKHSNGDYFCFIDSDDCIESRHIERMINVVRNNELLMCYSDFEATSEENRFGYSQDNSDFEILTQSELLKGFMLRKRQIHCCSLLISKEIINRIVFNEKLRFGEDVEFMWRVFSHVDRVGHCFQRSYKYLIRENSLMTTYSFDKDKVFVSEFRSTINQLIDEFPYRTDLYKGIYFRNILGWLHQLSRKTTFSQFKIGIGLLNESEMYRTLVSFDDKRVRILNFVMHINKRIFYEILRRV